jgi:hypothetical protein
VETAQAGEPLNERTRGDATVVRCLENEPVRIGGTEELWHEVEIADLRRVAAIVVDFVTELLDVVAQLLAEPSDILAQRCGKLALEPRKTGS